MPYFAGPAVKPALPCLPAVVYEILFNGYGFLSSLPWLAGLKRQLGTDSAMRKAVRDHRTRGADLNF
jgi:hypothetical protein